MELFSELKRNLINIGKESSLPDRLKSVLQPFVEIYKANLKPTAAGEKVVEAGRTLNKEI